jgi:hypothetical protein
MANPYELWQTHTLLATMRDKKPEDWYFGQFFTRQMRSTDEYIDFEKLPIRARKLAPYVLPMGRGRGIFDDTSRSYRFKPANVLVEEAIDPLRPLTFAPGIDASIFDMNKLTPMQRLALIKAEMTVEALLAIERRWEHQKARAIIDGKLTITYQSGEVFLVDFQRAAGHTQVLTSGNRWGDSGVSILGSIQGIVDTMNNAEFGGMPTRITMGGNVVGAVRNDVEVLKHMDVNLRGATVTVERGVISGANGGGKVYKFGELTVGGASGQRIELWVNNETYTADDGSQVRYLGLNEVVFTSTPEAIMGYECFGRIVDRDAEYQALPIFPKNYLTGDRVKIETLSFESAPLMVPIHSNATFKLTATA